MEKTIYNLAVQAGSALKGADKTQVAHLIEVFQSESDPVDAISLLMIHILRQNKRGELPREAQRLINHLYEILKFKDKERIRRAALKYLTLTKWVYETKPSKDYNNFQEYIQDIQSRLRMEGRP